MRAAQRNERRAAAWPEAPRRGLARDVRHIADVVADRRQGEARARAARQPLVAHRALSDRARTDDVAHPGRRPRLPDRLRFHRPSARHRDERRQARGHAARLAAALPISTPSSWRGSPRSGSMYASGRCRSRSSTPFRSPRIRAISEYRPEIAERLWRILLIADMALKRFRGDFVGKASPAHFFWGSFDLAMTRFSGRAAPEHPGGIPNLADWVTREAYSHEVWSAGFWPGTAGGFERPAFYAYAYPEPPGFADGAGRRPAPRPTARRCGSSCFPMTMCGARRPGGSRSGLPAEHLRGCRRRRPLGRATRLERADASACTEAQSCIFVPRDIGACRPAVVRWSGPC